METHRGSPLAGKLTVMGETLHESGDFEEAFLAKSTIFTPQDILSVREF